MLWPCPQVMAVGANCSQPRDNDYMFLSPTLTRWHWRPHHRHFRTVTVYRRVLTTQSPSNVIYCQQLLHC